MSYVPQHLAYEDLMQRPGLACERGDGFVRFVTPALRSWRKLGPMWEVGIIGLALAALWPLMFLFTQPRGNRLPLLMASSEFAIILALVIAAAAWKLSRRFVFEVDRDTFSLTRIGFGGRRNTIVFRRDAVHDIHINAQNGHLFIYVSGQDLIEIPLAVDAAAAQDMVCTLGEALRRDAGSIDNSLPRGLIAEHSSPLSPRWRTAMLTISGTLFLLGAALLWVGVPVLWLFALIIAAVPAGITLGTQQEKFWA